MINFLQTQFNQFISLLLKPGNSSTKKHLQFFINTFSVKFMSQGKLDKFSNQISLNLHVQKMFCAKKSDFANFV